MGPVSAGACERAKGVSPSARQIGRIASTSRRSEYNACSGRAWSASQLARGDTASLGRAGVERRVDADAHPGRRRCAGAPTLFRLGNINRQPSASAKNCARRGWGGAAAGDWPRDY